MVDDSGEGYELEGKAKNRMASVKKHIASAGIVDEAWPASCAK